MRLGTGILKLLEKHYEPGQLHERRFGKYDLAFMTDKDGFPILLFVGKRQANGRIKGERYARRLLRNAHHIIKDHWDYKGRTS